MFMIDHSDTLNSHTAQRNPIGTSKSTVGIAESAAYVSKEANLLNRVLSLKHSFCLNFALLFACVLILNREGFSVPSNNEFVYLLRLAKFWNPNLLSNDWTFSGPLPSHFVFNFVFGPLTLLFPLEVVGWMVYLRDRARNRNTSVLPKM
jgi:hypothetical protein